MSYPNVIGETNAGYEIIAQRPRSEHPDDTHLLVVMGKRGKDYVVWTYNHKVGGYSSGSYCPALGPALRAFNER